jgi:hypothetical protein
MYKSDWKYVYTNSTLQNLFDFISIFYEILLSHLHDKITPQNNNQAKNITYDLF